MIGNSCTKHLPIFLVVLCVTASGYAASDAQQLTISDGTQTTVQADEISRILALSEDVEYGEYLAGECASCHSEKKVDGSNVPVIHGADPNHLVQALLEYRAGTRSNDSMQLVATGLGEEEIAAVVHYLAASVK